MGTVWSSREICIVPCLNPCSCPSTYLHCWHVYILLAIACRLWHWDCINTFVYFSHHMVTVPPRCWIHAAHKHSVKVTTLPAVNPCALLLAILAAGTAAACVPLQQHQQQSLASVPLLAACFSPSLIVGTAC